jgi:hypothetical protein
VHRDLVATERIVAMDMAVRVRQLAEISRTAGVLEDDFAIEFFKVHG